MTQQDLLDDLATRVAAVKRSHPVRVAIDGVDAAGKTTLADELATTLERLGRRVIRASIDGFHRPAAIRRQRGSTSPEGYFHDSFDHDAILTTLLTPLGPNGSRLFRRRVFDFRTDASVDEPAESAPIDAILLFDGVFLLRPELRPHFDYSIFVRASFSTTLARAERRDLSLFGSVDEIRRRYTQRYIPGQELYLASAAPESVATVVVENDDPAAPALRVGAG